MDQLLKDLDKWSYSPICYLCQRSLKLQKHHKIFRSQGGGSTIPGTNESNLVSLCIVCHNAVHGIKSFDGEFNCDVCPKNCYFGQKFRGEPNVKKPW